jgi:hypothetical protein
MQSSESDSTAGTTTSDVTSSDATADTVADEDTVADTGEQDDSTGGERTLCHSYADMVLRCDPEETDHAYWKMVCSDTLELGARTDGQACLESLEDLYACISQLDCRADVETCAADLEAARTACPTVFG